MYKQVALVNQFGYPAEEHLVTTIDGYKLRLHRIPGSPSMPKAKGKPVVYFQHGIFSSSDTWILRGPNKDLGMKNLHFYKAIKITEFAL